MKVKVKRHREAVGELATTREIKKSLVSRDVEKKSSTLPLLISSLFGSGDVGVPSNMSEYIELYTTMVWVYSAVFAIANAGIRIPLKLYKRVSGGKEEITSHPILDLLKSPNPMMTWKDLLEATLIYCELAGEDYWEITYNRMRLPQELWVIKPTRITINTSRDRKKITSYTFKIGSFKHKFPANKILHFKNFAPTDDWHGQSSIQAVVNAIVTEQAASEYQSGFFKRGATPTGYIEVERMPGKSELRRLRVDWKQRFTGINNSYRTPILPRGMKYMPIGPSNREMELLSLRKANVEEILSAFGVPPVKVGLLGFAKYASYELQDTMFHIDTVIPKLQKVEGLLNLQLLPHYGDDSLFLEFDVDKYTQGDLRKTSEMFNRQIEHGVRTPNEVRLELGLKPYKGGNIHYISKQIVPVGLVERMLPNNAPKREDADFGQTERENNEQNTTPNESEKHERPKKYRKKHRIQND